MIRSSIEAHKISKWSELENNTKISRDSLEKFHPPKCSLLDAATKHSSKNSNRAQHRSKWSGIGAAGKDSRKNQSPKWPDREATSLGNQSPKWLDSEASDLDDNRQSSWGPLCRSQAVFHDGDINRGTNRWGTDLDQTGSDAWGHHSPSISPGRWNMSNRSRSRSPYGLKHGFEDLNDRGRMAMGGSSPLYSDFAERRHRGRKLDNKSSNWPESGKNSARIYKDDSDNSHNQNRRITNWGSDLDRTGAEWTQHSRSISPKGHWNRSSRRRSRSPPYGLMHESESWDNQDRIGMGESVVPSQDFAAGRCKSQWRDLHEDGARRHPDCGREGIREGKRMRYLGYDSWETFSDSSERRDYLRDRLFQRHGTHTTDEDDNEQHRDRGFRATCYDFLKGRCRRGSTCKFVHHDALPNAGRFMEDAPRGKAYHGRDLDASYGKRTEFQMTSNAPCKYFADGYCRRGEDCNFSHQHMPRRHSDDRLHDDRRYNRGNEKSSSWNGPKWGDSTTVDAPNTSLNGPKWGDRPATPDVPKSSSEVRNWGDKTTVDASKSSWPKWGDQSSSADAFISSWNGPKWGDLGTPVNVSNSLEYKRGDETSKVDAPISSLNGQQLVDPATVNSTKRDEQTTIMDAPNSFSKDPNWGDVTTTVDSPDSPHSPHQVSNGAGPGATIMDPLHIEDTTPEPLYSPSQNLEDDGYQNLQEEASPTAKPSENQSLIQEAPGKLQNVLIVSAQTMAESTYAQNPPCTGAEMVSCTSETVDASRDKAQIEKNVNFLTAASAPEKNFCKSLPQDQNEKAQLSFNLNSPPHDHLLSPRNNMAPQPSNPQSLKSDGQSDQEIFQQVMDSQNMQIIGEEVMPNAKLSEIKCSQSNPDTSITQKLTTSEQIARIAERPASMRHILGNGQQLPQPRIFNPIDCTDLASWSSFSNPSAAAAAPFFQRNQGSLPTECITVDSSNVPPVLPSMYVEREALKIAEESQTTKRSNPVSVTQGPHEGNPNKHTNVEFKLVELDEDTAKGVIDMRNGKGMKEIKTTMSEDVNAEIRSKVENKTINDEKVIRMFKFAIADFAKDILKPSWKEGHLSKEAHKTIVKKVVDKVTGTLEGNFPRTQEQIDLYMSYSKTKLTNLVQAYLGKFVRS